MTISARQKELMRERDARIRAGLLAGHSETHMMAVEGADPRTVGPIATALRKATGRKTKGKSPRLPHGLTDKTESMRMKLGDRLRDLRNQPLDRLEVARITGVTPVAGQNAALSSAPHYDWKMSELERLAEAGDTTFIELILRAARPTMVGFSTALNKAEKEKWNTMIRHYLIG